MITNKPVQPASQPGQPAVLTFSTFSLQRARIPKKYWYYGTPEGGEWWGSQGRDGSIVSLYTPTRPTPTFCPSYPHFVPRIHPSAAVKFIVFLLNTYDSHGISSKFVGFLLNPYDSLSPRHRVRSPSHHLRYKDKLKRANHARKLVYIPSVYRAGAILPASQRPDGQRPTASGQLDVPKFAYVQH